MLQQQLATPPGAPGAAHEHAGTRRDTQGRARAHPRVYTRAHTHGHWHAQAHTDRRKAHTITKGFRDPTLNIVSDSNSIVPAGHAASFTAARTGFIAPMIIATSVSDVVPKF